MSDFMNKQGSNCHPSLPSCPQCGSVNYATLQTQMGVGMTIQFQCNGCEAQCVWRYRNHPGVLIFVVEPHNDTMWPLLNAYNKAVHDFRLGIEKKMPVVPDGLHVYMAQGRFAWVKLERNKDATKSARRIMFRGPGSLVALARRGLIEDRVLDRWGVGQFYRYQP